MISLKKLLEQISLPASGSNSPTEDHYRLYFIKKADGGRREICAPSDELAAAQKKLLPYIRQRKVSRFCTAYEKGCSIKDNALRHSKGKHILHADIKNFFPSIKRDMVDRAILKGDASDPRTEKFFWELVSYKGGLPIGAPTSPFIANRVMRNIDKKLNRLSLFIRYTRYADDLVFSSRRPIAVKFLDKVEKVVRDGGFILNKKKTYFMASRKEVTGVLITEKGLSVGTSYKKSLKSEIYNLLHKGEGDIRRVRGRFAHLKNIEPEYAEVLRKKYASIDKVNFFKT